LAIRISGRASQRAACFQYSRCFLRAFAQVAWSGVVPAVTPRFNMLREVLVYAVIVEVESGAKPGRAHGRFSDSNRALNHLCVWYFPLNRVPSKKRVPLSKFSGTNDALKTQLTDLHSWLAMISFFSVVAGLRENLAGACSSGRFLVSTVAEAYAIKVKGLNRRF
jgi:hypothetical protein